MGQACAWKAASVDAPAPPSISFTHMARKAMQIFWSLTAIGSLLAMMVILTRW
jgi:hypothetical protein